MGKIDDTQKFEAVYLPITGVIDLGNRAYIGDEGGVTFNGARTEVTLRTDSEAYLTVPVYARQPALIVRLRTEFSEGDGSGGLLALFLDGQELLASYERYGVGSPDDAAEWPIPGGAKVGWHDLTIRLDVQDGIETAATVSDVELGSVGLAASGPGARSSLGPTAAIATAPELTVPRTTAAPSRGRPEPSVIVTIVLALILLGAALSFGVALLRRRAKPPPPDATGPGAAPGYSDGPHRRDQPGIQA